MKITGLYVATIMKVFALVAAFSDSSPFYSSEAFPFSRQYIAEASKVSHIIETLSDGICENGKQLVIYRVSGLQPGINSKQGSYVRHMHYGSQDDIHFQFGSHCTNKVQYLANANPEDAKDASVVVIEIEDGKTHTIDEFLTHDSVIVQGKPTFHSPESATDGVKHYIEEAVYNNLHFELDIGAALQKRNKLADAPDDESIDRIAAEVELDFRAVESMLASEGSLLVTALEKSSVSSTLDFPSATIPPKAPNSNLFTNYQFFTPGLWLCILISLFLVVVLMIALSWINSLEISYRAFEKQIDFDKKNE